MISGKLWRLCSRTQRRQYVVLLGLMLFGAALETMGIGLLLPLLALMTQQDLLIQHKALSPWLEKLGNPDQVTLVIIVMTAFMAINLIRIMFIAASAWIQTQFVKRFIAGLSHRLYAGYLSQPYTFHMQRNSAQLIRNTTSEVVMVANIVRNSLVLFTEFFVIAAIAALLLAVDPLGVLSVMTVMVAVAWYFHHLTRHRIYRWGKQRQQSEDMRIQQLQQGFGGVKEIKLMRLESFILEQYERYNFDNAQASQRHTFVQALPRLWLEMLAILGMGTYVIAVLLQGTPVEVLVLTLGLFVAAAFRLMPSVNRVLGSLQGIRFGTPSLLHLATEVESFAGQPTPVSPIRGPVWFSQAIVIDGVTYSYPTGNKPVLKQVSITIPRGSSVGFIGGSGAGKSTLIDLVLGLLTPTHGAVNADGIDIRERLGAWQSQIGYVPQTIYLTDVSLRRNIAFGLPEAQVDDVAVQRAMRLAQLEAFIEDLPQGLDTIVGERGVRLSGGQRQRIGIARALYYDPPVLVLDEATSALDNTIEEDLMGAISALHGQKTLLIVAHRLTTVARCDMIYRLGEGGILESGPPDSGLLNLSSDK